MKETGAIHCKGGIPTSMQESGQQWDFPNAWPPLQQLLVAGDVIYECTTEKTTTNKLFNRTLNSFKPVYNDPHREPKILVVVDEWSRLRGR